MHILPLNQILYDEDFNSRGAITEASVRELAESIKKNGLVQPILVRPIGGERPYHLVCGHRRFRAVDLLGWTEIKAFIVEMTLEEARIANLNENLERRNLSIMQEARTLAQIYGTNLPIHKIARDMGRSRDWVRQRKHVLKYAPSVQDLFDQKRLTTRDIGLLNMIPDEEREQVARELVAARAQGLVGPLKRSYKKQKLARSRSEIERMLFKMTMEGFDLPGRRCLAWAAGNIEEDELMKIE